MPRPLLPHLPIDPCLPMLRGLAEARNAQTGAQRGYFACGVPWALSSVLGCARETANRAIRDGLPWETADRLAVALGYHPANLWGDAWWAVFGEVA